MGTLAKTALLLLTDEKAQRGIGWVIVAALSPVILVIALLCVLASGAASHNVSVVELCFNGGTIPDSIPEEYQVYIADMRESFALLDSHIDEIDGLDEIRVKAIFYALYFGEDSPSSRDHQQFVDCFVSQDEEGSALPIEDLKDVYENISQTLEVEITEEKKSNADSIYILIRYGWTSSDGFGWSGELDAPVLSVEGFCSPLGANWRQMISSNFGWRNCPYHGPEYHSGLDMASPSGTPIRAALSGTVVRSDFVRSYGNYTVIDHGNGMTTAYAHQSKRLVSVGDRVEVGQVIGLVGSTGNSTGPHLHLEVRIHGQLQDPKLYLP